jgi:subtilisin family serine protease
MRLKSLLVICACAPLAVGLMACSEGGAQPETKKIKVESLDDIPRVVYAIEGSASELLMSDEFPAFAARVRADVEGLLEEYDIQDPTTLQTLYGIQRRLDFLEGDYDGALGWMEKSLALEDKEANRLTAGLYLRAWVAAREAVGAGGDDEAFRAAFAEQLRGAVEALPWEVVQENIEQSKGRAEYLSENLILGMIQSEIDPVVAKTGELTEDAARTLIGVRYTMDMFLPVRSEVAAVYGEMIAANRIVKDDIWGARAVTLDANSGAQPVVVAIWDAGVDAPVFEGSLWTNPAERFDGTDTDGNGFVDDVHGIGFDVNGLRTPELLHPEGDMAGKVDEVMAHTKGFMDLGASIDSPEASELKKYLGTLQPSEVKELMQGLSFAAMYMHGTHVAGIAIDGNPYAKVLISRYSFDYHVPRRLLTVEIAEQYARSHQDAVDYFKAAGVRAANMSWGWTLKEVEGVLEANGVTDPEERAARTREIFGILKQSLHDAIASAPEILFITAAGNEDNDVDFDEVIPSNFELPNLLVVAAVDQAGDPTSFTSGGGNVVIYANGYEVDSFVPGGGRMEMSGTSMAAPNALNLAAKLLALDPELGPGELIDLMKRGATPRQGDDSMLLIHQQRSVELLEGRTAHAG